jgi:hypothetical protein
MEFAERQTHASCNCGVDKNGTKSVRSEKTSNELSSFISLLEEKNGT